MTKQEYLFIKLLSGGGWFDWHDVRYTAMDFHRWQVQGFMERAMDYNYYERRAMKLDVSDWRLTPQAHNLLGVHDEWAIET